MDDLAVRLAVDGFIVFNIDYRLACVDPTVYLCGFLHPASILDVQMAIRWVRQNAGNYSPFTGRVAAVGTSAGGNLVYMAGDTGVTGDTKPDVMAGASGQPEMGYLSDLRPACEEAYLPFIGECWVDSTAYFGAPLDRTPDWCGNGGGDNWSPGSPACNVDPSNLPPPTFITNATEELSAYQGTLDFRGQLDGLVANQLCTVSGIHSHDHGTGLLTPGEPCDEVPGTDVLSNMVAFLKTYL
jgi:pectinesterase